MNVLCQPSNAIERLIHRYLDYWHGNGDANQWRYYRCNGCQHLVTWKQIEQGGCECGISNKIRPAALTFIEKARCLFAPWSLT